MTRDRTTIIGKRLASIRKRLGLTIQEAAERIGVNKATWSSWETGRRSPSRSHRLMIELLATKKL